MRSTRLFLDYRNEPRQSGEKQNQQERDESSQTRGNDGAVKDEQNDEHTTALLRSAASEAPRRPTAPAPLGPVLNLAARVGDRLSARVEGSKHRLTGSFDPDDERPRGGVDRHGPAAPAVVDLYGRNAD